MTHACTRSRARATGTSTRRRPQERAFRGVLPCRIGPSAGVTASRPNPASSAAGRLHLDARARVPLALDADAPAARPRPRSSPPPRRHARRADARGRPPVVVSGALRRHLALALAEVADAERALDDVQRIEPLDVGDGIQAARRLACRSYRKEERALEHAAQARAAGNEALARAYERLARSWRWGGDLDARAGHLLRHIEATVVHCRGILRRIVERRLHLAERELGEVARETARVLEREVRCGARTRRGTSCAAPRVRGRARCKLHGAEDGRGEGPLARRAPGHHRPPRGGASRRDRSQFGGVRTARVGARPLAVWRFPENLARSKNALPSSARIAQTPSPSADGVVKFRRRLDGRPCT